MSEETFEVRIEEQIKRIDDAVDKGMDSIEFVLSIRAFLRDLSVSALIAYNPYEMHPQGQDFFPCMYRVIIAKNVAQLLSDELSKSLRKSEPEK